MNRKPQNEKISRRRRLKFGALAVSLTVVVIALVVIVNAVFTALVTKNRWYVDMTREKLYGISQASLDLLEDLRGNSDLHIKIVFCSYEDQLKTEYYSNMVLNLARMYEEEFNFISVEFIDIINHPEAVRQYMATSVSAPKTTSVIITDGHQSRLLELKSFYTFDSDSGSVFAFNGEYRITGSILQMAGDNPIAYFVEGHGEENTGTVLWSLMEDAGFDVRTIDLTKETPDESARLMVVNAPKYDFLGDSGEEKVNEIKKIDNFLDRRGGLMVFLDATSGELPELEALLSEWGIGFEQKKIIDYENSLSVDGTELVAEYATEGTGSSMTTKLRGLESSPKAIVRNAKPVVILNDTVSMGSSSREITPILTTSGSRTAQGLSLTDPDAAVETEQIYNLMAVSIDGQYIENEAHYAYVLAAGTSSFADDKYIGSRAYGNRDIIFSAIRTFSRKTVPLDLDFKVFESTSLTVTRRQANTWTVLCTAFLPLAVSAVGVWVYVRRKNL